MLLGKEDFSPVTYTVTVFADCRCVKNTEGTGLLRSCQTQLGITCNSNSSSRWSVGWG